MNLHLPAFNHAKVLVIGDIMLDRYWHGATARISPEAPVPVVNIQQVEEKPGGAANVAVNLATLGLSTTLLGITGNDDAACSLDHLLSNLNIQCDFVKSAHPTLLKLRIVSRHQQLLRLDFEETFTTQHSIALLEKFMSVIANCDLVIFSDYAKGTLQNIEALIEIARQHNKPVLVDPKGKDFSIYRGATLLTPNLAEFETVVGHCKNEEELIAKAKTLIKELNLSALLVTRGEKGMTLIRPHLPELHLPARAQEVYDVTGAGDTVIATLGAALASNLLLEDAVTLANIAASIVVSKLGTASVSESELKQAVYQEHLIVHGVLSEAQLTLALEQAKARGEKIVMTNGCFDILHAGHVAYLTQAKKLGDRLIVAVNSDASVKKLKGEGRPINSVDRRMAVLAGLASIDWVIEFSEETPHRLLHLIKPDILVKGGDYTLDGIIGAEVVNAYGGEVRLLGAVEDCSTTNIVNKIRG